MNSKRTLFKIGVALVGVPSMMFATTSSANNAIAVNRSARMRALCMRMAKFKAQQLLLGNSDSITDQILGTEKLVTSHLGFLASVSSDANLKPRFEALRISSTGLMKLAFEQATKDVVLQANKLSLDTLAAANDLTAALEANSKNKDVSVVNLAGRQRMLSQRMTKDYFLLAASLADRTTSDNISADRLAFNDSLTKLQSSPVSNAAMKSDCSKIAASFKRFETLIADTSERGYAKPNIATIAAQSEQLLSACHELTMQFEDAVKAKETAV